MDRRWVWAGVGTLIIIATIAAGAPNLQEIYHSQKDFVIGSMLSLAGFAFGKAVDRSQQNRDQWLQESGSSEHLAKLEEHVTAAAEKLAEHYWGYSDPPERLASVYEEMAKASTHLDRLRHSLGGRFAGEEWDIPVAARLQLDGIRRDMREALNRLNVSRKRLAKVLAEGDFRQAWDVFDVLEMDLRQANRNLDPLVRERVMFPPEEQLRKSANYLQAALLRSAEFRKVLEQAGIDLPETFKIMDGDLHAAKAGLDQVSFSGGRRPAS